MMMHAHNPDTGGAWCGATSGLTTKFDSFVQCAECHERKQDYMDKISRISKEFAEYMIWFMDHNEGWMMDMARIRHLYEEPTQPEQQR